MTPHDWMLIVLAVAALIVFVSMWVAHRNSQTTFNGLDLIMVDGKVDRIASAFMLVLGVTTWVMIDLQIKGRMSEGYLTTYGAMWVIPLVAKVLFNKSDMPGVISSTTVVQQTTEVTKP